MVSGIGIAGSGYPEKIPAYTLWDAAIRFDLSQVSQANLLMSLNIGNLADKRFVTTCTGTDFHDNIFFIIWIFWGQHDEELFFEGG